MKRALILLVLCSFALTCVVGRNDAQAFEIGSIGAKWVFRSRVELVEEQNSSIPTSAQDRVNVSNRIDEVTVTVLHRRGIGCALLRLHLNQKGRRKWPAVRLRFKNFKGLEGLKVMNGGKTISLHDEDGSPPGQHLDLKRKGKGVDVEVPADFLQREDRLLQVEWVDFYR